MTNQTTFEKIFEKIESKPLKKRIEAVGVVTDQLDKILLELHQLRLRYWLDYQTATHKAKYWTENEITKKDAKVLFDDFLVLHENAKGEKFDNYQRMYREQTFVKWQMVMRGFFEKNKKFSDKEYSKSLGKGKKK